MFNKSVIIQHKASIAIFIFLTTFTIFHFMKPDFAYGKDGEFRQFGVGYRNKTVIPVWFVSIGIAILSYLVVLYYLRL